MQSEIGAREPKYQESLSTKKIDESKLIEYLSKRKIYSIALGSGVQNGKHFQGVFSFMFFYLF